MFQATYRRPSNVEEIPAFAQMSAESDWIRNLSNSTAGSSPPNPAEPQWSNSNETNSETPKFPQRIFPIGPMDSAMADPFLQFSVDSVPNSALDLKQTPSRQSTRSTIIETRPQLQPEHFDIADVTNAIVAGFNAIRMNERRKEEVAKREEEKAKNLENKIGFEELTKAQRRALTSAEAARLTTDRRKHLCESFAFLKRHFTHNCLTIFIRLFSEYPLYKDLWPQFRAIPDSSLMYSAELKKHVQVYSRGLNSIVAALDNEKDLYLTLRKLAKSHAKRQIYKNHIMNMLPEVLTVLRTSGAEVTPEVEDAWNTLFDVLGNLVDPLKTDALEALRD